MWYTLDPTVLCEESSGRGRTKDSEVDASLDKFVTTLGKWY